MSNFSIQPGQLIKQTRVWGLGSIIGDRQKTITFESDYEDMAAVEAAISASFAQEPVKDAQATFDDE